MNAIGTAPVAEELRFFIRIGLFTVLIGAIYWFVSYEEAGTWLLAGIVASVVFFVVLVAGRARSSRRGGRGIKHLLGFADSAPEAPLALDEDTFPLFSAWPAVISLAAVLVGLGLIYGPWLWIPGVAMGLAGAWGWLTESG
jgi:hypothetical protein